MLIPLAIDHHVVMATMPHATSWNVLGSSD